MRTIEEVCSELRKKTDLLSHYKSKQYEVTCKACDEIMTINREKEDKLRDQIVEGIMADVMNDERIKGDSFNAIMDILENHVTK